jgi:hypothetical protein
MAIELGDETLTLTKSERTWRVEIFVEHGDDPIIRAHREVVMTDADGKVSSRDRAIPTVERRLSAIAGKTYAGLTGAELAGAIAAWADGLRQEDIAAAKGGGA